MAVLVATQILLAGCGTTAPTEPDERLEVSAALLIPRGEELTTEFLYGVRIQNRTGGLVTISRIDVEALDGPSLRRASLGTQEVLEPGQSKEFRIWAELDTRENPTPGRRHTLARIIVSYEQPGVKRISVFPVSLL